MNSAKFDGVQEGKSGGRGSFQVGQTAKARSGYRVQSLPKDATASFRSMVSAGAAALNPVNAVVQWSF